MGVAQHKGNAVLPAHADIRIDCRFGCRFVDPAESIAFDRVVWIWFGTWTRMVVFVPDPFFRSASNRLAACAPWQQVRRVARCAGWGLDRRFAMACVLHQI